MPPTTSLSASWLPWVTLGWALSTPLTSPRSPLFPCPQEVARHLVASRPADLSATPALPQPSSPSSISSPSSGAVAPAADEVAAAASAAALAADRPWLDPRSAVKLAWAFASCEVKDAAALDVVAEAAEARIASQLQVRPWVGQGTGWRRLKVLLDVLGCAWGRGRTVGSVPVACRCRVGPDASARPCLETKTPQRTAPAPRRAPPYRRRTTPPLARSRREPPTCTRPSAAGRCGPEGGTCQLALLA